MKRVSLLLATIFYLSTSTMALAQSNHDLAPPLQVDSTQLEMSPDPQALATFKFAMAKLNDDGEVEVATTIATQKLVAPLAPKGRNLSKGIPYTETVEQTYTVHVPYTEVVDGKSVTRVRAETRTRKVPVTRIRKRNAEEQAEYDAKMAKEKKTKKDEPEVEYAKQESVTTTFSIQVPYTEIVDGKPVTKTRTETRTRTINVMRGKTKTIAQTKKRTCKIESVKCFSVEGTELESSDIKKRLAENCPVILINSRNAIGPYFEAILKPETLFMVCKEK